jgi:exopolysaccharide biosynthesis polyprenyl glycosylphosphotransferase
MLREFRLRRIVFFFLVDWLGSLVMLALAGMARSDLGELPALWSDALALIRIPVGGTVDPEVKFSGVPIEVFALVAMIWPLAFVSLAVYDGKRNETFQRELLNVLRAIGVSIVALAGILFLTYRETSRVMFVLFFVFDVVFLLGARVGLFVYRQQSQGRFASKRRVVLVVGAGKVGREVVAQLKKYAWNNVAVVGYLDDAAVCQGELVEGLPVLGTLDQVEEIQAAYAVQDAIVALPLRAHERLVDIARVLQRRGVRVYVIPDLFALSFPSMTLDGFGGIPVIDLGAPGIQGWQRFVKRAFDVLVVSVSLLLLAPFLALVAVLIKLDSAGPVLYRQERIGENGRVFTMFKFRSMRADTDTALHRRHVAQLITQNLTPQQLDPNGSGTLKLEDDPRVTRVGKFIRKMSIDEFPQFFNVLRGEMSLVGPRPPIPYEVDLYQDWHKRRFEAIPGITGLWQVKGRNRVSFDEMVRMDVEYIEKQTLWLDIKILLQTPLVVLIGRGAG